MSDVEIYEAPAPVLFDEPGGGWVSHADYQALQARVTELERRLTTARETIRGLGNANKMLREASGDE